jgi:hypothetical protein
MVTSQARKRLFIPDGDKPHFYNNFYTFIEECRQSDYQEKKGQATIYKTPHRKLTIEQHGSAKTNPGVNSGFPALLLCSYPSLQKQ